MQRNLYDGVPIDEVPQIADPLPRAARSNRSPGYSYVTARLLMHTDAPRNTWRGSHAGGNGDALRRLPAGLHPEGHRRPSCSTRSLGQYDLKRAGRCAQCAARPAVRPTSACRPCTTATSCTSTTCASKCRRRSSCAWRWAWHSTTKSTAKRARSSSTTCCRASTSCRARPTLFNSGTRRSQLSSCYLTTVADDLDGIYEAIKENALLSKFAGGLGNDWTPVRALGAYIKGTNGKIAGRGAVPEGGQRHGRGGEPGRQAQGRGLRRTSRPGTWTSRSSSSCARTPATTAAAPTT